MDIRFEPNIPLFSLLKSPWDVEINELIILVGITVLQYTSGLY